MKKVTAEMSEGLAQQVWESAIRMCDHCNLWMLEDEGLEVLTLEGGYTFCSDECSNAHFHPTKIYLKED